MAEPKAEEKPITLREQGGAVVSDVRRAALHATAHLEAIVELFQLELQEYGRRQVRRVAAIAVGAALLFCAYLMLCFYAASALQPLLKQWSIPAVVAFNVLVGLVLLLVGLLKRPAGVAPSTVQEIKNDIECAKLYLKGKEKS